MYNKKKLFKLERTVSVLCIVFCLLITLSSRLELSAKADLTSITVGPSESIQAAIDNATAGETIFVSAGIYNESLQINKTISLIGEDRDTTIINGQNNQFIINIAANDVTIQGFTVECTSNLNPTSGIGLFIFGGCTISNNIVKNSQQGMTLASSNNNTISDNIFTNSQLGIAFAQALNNVVSDNVITANSQGGISLITSNNNNFSGNIISDNYAGIYMYTAGGNNFAENTFINNYPAGETISVYCFHNIFYDNNFYDPIQVGSNSNNYWDNGHQGNYWSSYVGQNDGYGISTGSYTLAPGGNRDNYPLMGKFSIFTATYVGEPYQISVVSNSTISGFEFQVGTETGNEIIQFNVTDAEDSGGFSRIAIPTALMNASVTVLVGDLEIAPTWHIQNNVSNTLYFTYISRNQTILIISSKTLNLYSQLLTQFLTLNATYYELLSNYTKQSGILSNETAQLQLFSNYAAQLNDSYNGLFSNYASLLGNYSQLQQKYQDLNSSYQQHLSDDDQNLQNVRSLMFIFAAGTAVLIVATVYFSKRMYSRPKETSEKREAILSRAFNSPVCNF